MSEDQCRAILDAASDLADAERAIVANNARRDQCRAEDEACSAEARTLSERRAALERKLLALTKPA